MGTYIFRLPDIGEGVAEAEIVAWHVKVGDIVEEDQVLVDVMTDKATVEMTSPVSGIVQALHGEVGSQLIHLRHRPNAPAAAPIPEIQNHDLATQVGELHGLAIGAVKRLVLHQQRLHVVVARGHVAQRANRVAPR